MQLVSLRRSRSRVKHFLCPSPVLQNLGLYFSLDSVESGERLYHFYCKALLSSGRNISKYHIYQTGPLAGDRVCVREKVKDRECVRPLRREKQKTKRPQCPFMLNFSLSCFFYSVMLEKFSPSCCFFLESLLQEYQGNMKSFLSS